MVYLLSGRVSFKALNWTDIEGIDEMGESLSENEKRDFSGILARPTFRVGAGPETASLTFRSAISETEETLMLNVQS